MHIPAIVPIKANSERVLNKNTRLFGGKPLFHHILSLLQSSQMISKIFIDTDSKDIANSAASEFSKVQIIMRPSDLCGDMVPFERIIEHDISLMDDNHFVQTFSTCPLMKKETLELAINKYFELIQHYDSLFSVKKIQKHLYWESGELINNYPNVIRTQDLPPIYARNACIFLFSKDSFRKAGARIGKHAQMFPMSAIESTDIDEESDFLIGELLFKHYHQIKT